MSAKEFREYATECMDWARTARRDEEREIFLQMAKTWLEAAIRSEIREKLLVENGPLPAHEIH